MRAGATATRMAAMSDDDAAVETARPAAVSIRALSKSFDAVKVLQETSLDIHEGEFFSLLGPSGCGKTTLLRIIGGFETPTSGDVRISGRSALADPPYRRRTNMIFQHLALFPHLTVAQNIAFGLEMKKVDRKIIDEKVAAALALVRLSEMGGRRIDALSGGQKQRIAMARALVNEPDVLLLDEPLGALDLQLRLQMQEELRRLHRETGRTFIFVTHDQTEAMTMSDRIAVMGNGRILQIGTPKEVYQRPQSRFVAHFMGHSNFLEGKVAAVGLDRTGRVEASGIHLPCRIPAGIDAGTPVLFALRYEKIELEPEAAGGASGIAGAITSQTYMGPLVRFEVRVSNQVVMTADLVSQDRDSRFAVGDRVRLRWSLDAPTALTD